MKKTMGDNLEEYMVNFVEELDIQSIVAPSDCWDEWNNATLMEVGQSQKTLFEEAGITAEQKPLQPIRISGDDGPSLTQINMDYPSQTKEYAELLSTATNTVRTLDGQAPGETDGSTRTLVVRTPPKVIQECCSRIGNTKIKWNLVKYALPSESTSETTYYTWNPQFVEEEQSLDNMGLITNDGLLSTEINYASSSGSESNQSPAKASSSSSCSFIDFGTQDTYQEIVNVNKSTSTTVQSVGAKNRALRRFVCDTCGEDLSYEWVLKKHRLVHMPLEGRPLARCPYGPCGIGYRASATMMKHLKKAHKEFAIKYLAQQKEAKRNNGRRARDMQENHGD